MTPFAGYDMPLQYEEGALSSHVHVRTQAGLFDVSHMGQLLYLYLFQGVDISRLSITGKDRNEFIELVTLADMQSLKLYQGSYTLIPNEKGGIIDDSIVTNQGDRCN